LDIISAAIVSTSVVTEAVAIASQFLPFLSGFQFASPAVVRMMTLRWSLNRAEPM